MMLYDAKGNSQTSYSLFLANLFLNGDHKTLFLVHILDHAQYSVNIVILSYEHQEWAYKF